MKAALLLDYRNKNTEWYIQTVLNGILKDLSGLAYIQFYQRCNGDTLQEREQESKRIMRLMESWNQEQEGTQLQVKPYCDTLAFSSGPCTDWFKNIWLAFQDPTITHVIYFPFDITYLSPKVKPGDSRLQGFIDFAHHEQPDLLLGLYEARTLVSESKKNQRVTNFLASLDEITENTRKDIPKNYLEDFTILELWNLFPETMQTYFTQRNDVKHAPKPRTGFFALSRELFNEFIHRPFRSNMLPWAGTVQLLITALIKNRVTDKTKHKIKEYYISKIHEPASNFSFYGTAHQRERISFVIRDEHAYWKRIHPELAL